MGIFKLPPVIKIMKNDNRKIFIFMRKIQTTIQKIKGFTKRILLFLLVVTKKNLFLLAIQ